MKRALTVALVLILVLTCLPLTALAYSMPYKIGVDITNQIVTVYDAKDGSIVRQMICSSGANGATPLGTWKLPIKNRPTERTEWHWFLKFKRWGHYPTRICGGIMFHSLPYFKKDESTLDPVAAAKLGTPASHGCLRLRTEDAKWIALNCAIGTTCKIYESGKRDDELRDMLLESSYSRDSGMTFEEYYGITDDPDILGRGAKGDNVTSLQYRLRALGYLDQDASGFYDSATIHAIKEVQKTLGLPQNGLTDKALEEYLYTPDAPTTMNVTMTDGMIGPLVKALQKNLAALRLYSGDLDGVYDVDVMESAQCFERAYGYPETDTVPARVQRAIAYEAERITSEFGGDVPAPTEETFEMDVATVSCKTRLHLLDDSGTAVGTVNNGSVVFPLEIHGKTVSVQYGGATGRIDKDTLKPVHSTFAALTYTKGSKTVTVGHTQEGYRTNAVLPAEVFESTAIREENAVMKTAEVALNGAAEALNLRATPDTDAEILASLPDGTALTLLGTDNGWARVTAFGIMGYVMTDYIASESAARIASEGQKVDLRAAPDTTSEILTSLSDGTSVTELGRKGEWANVSAQGFKGWLPARCLTAETADDGTDNAEEEDLTAAAESKIDVYDSDADNAKRIGSLKKGTKVTVVESDEDWSLIRLGTNEGYVYTADLKFEYET